MTITRKGNEQLQNDYSLEVLIVAESINEAYLSNRFDDLKVRWNNVQETYESFVNTVDGEASIETEG